MNEINTFLGYFQAGDLWSIEHQFKPEYLEIETGNLIKVIQESIRVGKIEIVEFLFSKGCNFDISDEEGMKPIHHACIHGRINILHLFRKMDLDFEPTDDQGMQPIHHACVHGRLNIVQFFQENKFNLEQPDISGLRPIHHACKYGRIDIVKFFHENGFYMEYLDNEEMRPIHHACVHNQLHIVQFLYQIKCDMKAKDKQNMQPIHHACVHGRLNIVQFFQENKFNLEQPDISGLRPIHHACIHGRIDIVKFFHEKSLNMEYLDNEEMRPIHHACVHNQLHIVQFLYHIKCNMKAKDKRSWTPLDHANHHARSEIVQFLIAYQPNLESPICGEESSSFYNSCEDNTLHLKIKKKIQNIIDNFCPAESCNHLFCYNTIFSKKSSNKILIGKGAFGKVYKIKDPEMNIDFAVKTLGVHSPEEKKEANNLEQDIDRYREKLNHSRIIRFYTSSIKDNKIFIFMEYAEKGSLTDEIYNNGPFEHSKIIRYSRQVLEGLAFLHKNEIIHRDVKPDNILIFKNEAVKLSDFGLSKIIKSISKNRNTGGTNSRVGTANYIAPEAIRNEMFEFSADIWSLGATIIEMLTGKPPYAGLREEAIIFKIANTSAIEFKPHEPMSKAFEMFHSSMLEKNWKQRPSAVELLKNIDGCLL